MAADEPDASWEGQSQTAAISNAVVRLLAESTGRGATQARIAIDRDLVVDSDADGRSEDGELPRGVRLPSTFFGIVTSHAYASEAQQRAAELGQIAGTGVGTVRQTFEWSKIEILPGVWNFSAYDSSVLFEPPSFRSSRPVVGAQRGAYPRPTGRPGRTRPPTPRCSGRWAPRSRARTRAPK